MAFFDRIRTLMFGKHPALIQFEKAHAEFIEAQERKTASCQALTAACRADRADSIRVRRQILASIRRMQAESPIAG